MTNNSTKVANQINAIGFRGVLAVPDDGSVCVEVFGDRARVLSVVEAINGRELDRNGISDGVQEGSIFINGEQAEIHDEIVDLV